MVRGLAFIPKAVLKIQRSCTESYKVGFERQYSVNSFDFPIDLYLYSPIAAKEVNSLYFPITPLYLFPRSAQEEKDYYFPIDLHLDFPISSCRGGFL
jgi:hypothetical protein